MLGPTIYLYDGFNSLEEVDQSGSVLARYTQTTKVDEPLAELRSGATSYYDGDALGSITSLGNSAGALAQTYAYDSFGKLTASTGMLTNPFQYTQWRGLMLLTGEGEVHVTLVRRGSRNQQLLKKS